MTIREITSEDGWEAFIRSLNPNTFLHAWSWGQVQKRTGEEVRYLGFSEGNNLVAGALVVVVNARRGRHYLVPHGPLGISDEKVGEALPLLVEHLRRLAKRDDAVCLRVAPLQEDTPSVRGDFLRLGFRPAPLHVHAELTWVLDVTAAPEELLSGMRKTTRHAIRKAENDGADVDIITTPEGLTRFMPLYSATQTRHQFVPFSRHFLSVQAEEFSRRGQLFFAIVRHKNHDLAAAMCMHYGSTVFYHHGASLSRSGSPPASQLVQWAAIKEAKRRGATRYNFWGIAPDNEPNHPFAGLTVFKKGFGGQAINYLHAQDLPLSLHYWQLWAVEKWRKHLRGF